MKRTLRILALVLLAPLCMAATRWMIWPQSIPAVPEGRSDAIAVFDMQTLDGSNIANLVASSSEYDLARDVIIFDGSHPSGSLPAVDSYGLNFPDASGGLSNNAVAAGTGTASVNALTIYVAFRRYGTAPGDPSSYTRLLDTNLVNVRTLDNAQHPRIRGGSIDKFVPTRWNDDTPHLLTVVMSSGTASMYLDGCLEATGTDSTSYPATLSQFKISSLTEGFAGKIYYAAAFNTAHDAATQAIIGNQIKAILATRSVTLNLAPNYLIVEGDSISQPYYASVSLSDQYHYRAITALAPIPATFCPAIAGNTIADLAARASLIDAQYNGARTKNVLTVFAGTNDLSGGSGAATAFAALKAYCQARQATGWTVVVCTAVAKDAAVDATFEAKRVTFNQSIRDDSSFYSALADFGADAEMGDPAEAATTTYFYDGVHPNAAGHARMYPIYKAALESVGLSPPAPVLASINSAGTTLSVTWSAAVSTGAGGNGGIVLDPTGADVTLTYSSGSGTTGWNYTISRPILRSVEETAVLNYTQPGNGLEATTGGADVLSFSSFTVANNSTQTGGSAPTPDLLWWKMNNGSGSTITADVGPNGSTSNSPGWTSSTQNGSGYAMVFDGLGSGSGKYAATSAAMGFSSATAITISFWTKRNANSGLQVLCELSGVWDTHVPSFIVVVDSNELYAGIKDSGGGTRQEKCAIGSGSWTHVALVLDQAAASGVGDVKIYLNGTLQSTTITSNTKTSSASFSGEQIFLGARSGGFFGYDGDVDDFQVISGEVSAANISAIYAGGSH